MLSRDRPRQRRLDMGLTQAEVGYMVGISRSAVQKHEKGIVKGGNTSTVELFVKALRCSPAYLMCWTNDPRAEDDRTDQALDHLVSTWSELNDEGRAKVLQYAEDIANNTRYHLESDPYLIAARGGANVVEVRDNDDNSAIDKLFKAVEDGEGNG